MSAADGPRAISGPVRCSALHHSAKHEVTHVFHRGSCNWQAFTFALLTVLKAFCSVKKKPYFSQAFHCLVEREGLEPSTSAL
jgi:hypothetical protein